MADEQQSEASEGDGKKPAQPKVRRVRKTSISEQSLPIEPSSAPPSPSTSRRGRSNRPFPAGPFEEAFEFTKQIFEFGSGQPVRRLSLFDHLQRTPDSGTSRQLVTNANKYSLIKGNFNSEQLELTADGKRICDEATPPRERARLKAKLAISDIIPFDALYQRLANAKLPARAALIDAMRDNGVQSDYLEEGVDTFIVNLKAAGLLQNLSGADRVVTIDHLLDALPGSSVSPSVATINQSPFKTDLITQETATFETT